MVAPQCCFASGRTCLWELFTTLHQRKSLFSNPATSQCRGPYWTGPGCTEGIWKCPQALPFRLQNWISCNKTHSQVQIHTSLQHTKRWYEKSCCLTFSKLCRRPSAGTGHWGLWRATGEDADAIVQLLGTRLGPESCSITYYPSSINYVLFSPL